MNGSCLSNTKSNTKIEIIINLTRAYGTDLKRILEINMTPKDKRTYIELLIKAIADHDEDFSVDMHTGAVCWEVETNKTVYCTPAWEYVSDERLELPDDGDIGVTFDWIDDDRDRTVRTMFFTSYDNIESDVADYMHILSNFREEHLK